MKTVESVAHFLLESLHLSPTLTSLSPADFSGILRVEDVPGAMLGLLPCRRLLQEAIWGSAGIIAPCHLNVHPEGKGGEEFKLRPHLSYSPVCLSPAEAMHTLTALLPTCGPFHGMSRWLLRWSSFMNDLKQGGIREARGLFKTVNYLLIKTLNGLFCCLKIHIGCLAC